MGSIDANVTHHHHYGDDVTHRGRGGAAATPPPADDFGCFKGLLQVAGYAFGILTVVINIADVTTDVIVAIQFHDAGETTWFWLVVSSLIVAHLVYTFIGTAVLIDQPGYTAWRRVAAPARFILSLIFAQLIPIINLCVELGAGRGDHNDDDDDYDWRTGERDGGNWGAVALGQGNGRGNTTQAAREELNEVRRSQILQSQMAAALESHMMKYGLFYVESAVEAAPQAIIQLLAITFLGRATPAQLVSLCCSLFSITSKAFVISQAYDARVMVFKFALAAHDVFSTFYLFSTLVAQETHKDADFFGLEVSWLGYVWLWKLVGYGIIGVVSGLVAAIVVCVDDSGIERLYGFGVYLAGLCLSAPIALVVETLKTTFLSIHITSTEPRRRFWSFYGLVFSFLDGDGFGSDKSRLRHYCEFIVDNASAKIRPFRKLPRRQRQAIRQNAQLSHGDSANAADYHRVQSLGATFIGLREAARSEAPFDEWKARACMFYVHHRDENGRDYVGPPVSPAVSTGFSCGDQDCKEVVMGVWGGFVAVVYTLGQIYSFIYPFANAGVNFDTHNILQATCFYAACAALLVALLFAPVAYRYWRLNATLVRISQSIHMDVRLTLDMVADYHAPPHIGCLQEAVPVAVLPAEVTAVCGAFVDAADVGLGTLSIAECNALKRRIASSGARDVELAPIGPGALVPVGPLRRGSHALDDDSDMDDEDEDDAAVSNDEELARGHQPLNGSAQRMSMHPLAVAGNRHAQDAAARRRQVSGGAASDDDVDADADASVRRSTAVHVTSPGASSDGRSSRPFGGSDDADRARTFSSVVGDGDGAATLA